MNITDFPLEILCNIFEFLDNVVDCFKFRRLCQMFSSASKLTLSRKWRVDPYRDICLFGIDLSLMMHRFEKDVIMLYTNMDNLPEFQDDFVYHYIKNISIWAQDWIPFFEDEKKYGSTIIDLLKTYTLVQGASTTNLLMEVSKCYIINKAHELKIHDKLDRLSKRTLFFRLPDSRNKVPRFLLLLISL